MPPPTLKTVFHTSLVVRLAICGMGCGNGDDIVFCADRAGEKRPPAVVALSEVKKQTHRQRVGIALDVGVDAGGSQKRVTVVIEVVELGRNVLRKIIAQNDAGGEAVPDASLRGSGRRIDGAVAVQAVTDVRANFELLLSKGRAGEKQ